MSAGEANTDTKSLSSWCWTPEKKQQLCSQFMIKKSLFLFSERKGGCTHGPWVSAHERWWLYFCGIQVRDSALAPGAPVESPFFFLQPSSAARFPDLLCQLAWSSAPRLPFFLFVQNFYSWPKNKSPRNKDTRVKKKKPLLCELPPPWSTRLCILGCLGCDLYWTLLRVFGLVEPLLSVREAELFRFKGLDAFSDCQ